MKQTIAVVAGGDLFESQLDEIRTADTIIGVDYGALWLIQHSIIPEYAVGDFDSVTKEEKEEIKKVSPHVVQYKSEKDETDLEIGLRTATSLSHSEIVVYGMLGSRFDHSLAAVYLLEKFKVWNITYKHPTNELCLVTKKKVFEKSSFPYFSLIPLSGSARVSLVGCKYPLQKRKIFRASSLGISNEIVETKAVLTVYSGKILCLKTRDRA